MAWRDRLLPAAFKGAAFKVESATGTKGRRVSVAKFAGRDGSEQLDHGREPDAFDVLAFVAGDDYDIARDDLEAALVDPGPGQLTLPTRGDLWVRVTRGPVTLETKDEGGYCSIRFSVVVEDREAGRGLRATTDTSSELTSAAAAVKAEAAADFGSAVQTKSFAAQQLARTLGLVGTATRAITRIQRTISGTLSPVTSLTQQLDELNAAAITLLATPAQFATTAIDLVFTAYQLPELTVAAAARTAGLPLMLETAFARGRAARLIDRASGALRGYGEPFLRVATSSLSRRAEDAAFATGRLFRAAALAAQAEAYASVAFDSATFALGALARTLREIDQVVLLTPPDTMLSALEDLRAKLATHIYQTASQLPETRQVELRHPLPALVLAHELYGDARQSDDLVARNGLPEPLFAQGVLEVLRP